MDKNAIPREFPKSAAQLRAEVRAWSVRHPEQAESLRAVARVPERGQPDLFGWVRLWLAVRARTGAPVDAGELFELADAERENDETLSE